MTTFAELKALGEDATEGPWSVSHQQGNPFLRSVKEKKPWGRIEVMRDLQYDTKEADAAFIVAARNHWAALIAIAEANHMRHFCDEADAWTWVGAIAARVFPSDRERYLWSIEKRPLAGPNSMDGDGGVWIYEDGERRVRMVATIWRDQANYTNAHVYVPPMDALARLTGQGDGGGA